MTEQSLTIFDIGFTCGIDGPGQRMVVYLKGCNLHCPWCAAPESISPSPEVLFYPERVPDLPLLRSACPFGAVGSTNGRVTRDTTRCRVCTSFPCVESGIAAFERCGETRSVVEILELVRQYRAFFGKTGGVTFGGGEPTYQFVAVNALLAAIHADGIHTALETNGLHPLLPELFSTLDMLYIDLKHPDPAQCAVITGQDNAVTLANIRARAAAGEAMVVRIPLAPGYNADAVTLRAFGETLAGIGPLTIELLPFHRRGEVKWQALGKAMPASNTDEPSVVVLEAARAMLREYGLQVQ